MRNVLLFCFFAFTLSCTEEVKKESDFFDAIEKKEEIYKTIDERIIRHIEGNLSISATEKYTYQVYKSELNGDDSLDYIITVNRLEKAIDEAIAGNDVAKRAEIGYMGNFNYYFFMDGLSKEITTAIAVPSSPNAELVVNFEHIRSEGFNDFTIDFRIRNSKFRRFYTVVKNVPRKTFEAKIFDRLGENNPEAYFIKFQPGSFSLAKDILVYKGSMKPVVIN